MTIEDRIRDVIARELAADPDRVTLDARLAEDLGADMLDVTMLTMSLEDEFDVVITDEGMEQIKTPRDAGLLISTRAAASAAPTA